MNLNLSFFQIFVNLFTFKYSYKMEKIDIVIIGAGIAGIASAYHLKKTFLILN